MTDDAASSTAPTSTAPTLTLCHCGHPVSEHDVVGLRFCAATRDFGHQRDCICRMLPPKPMSRR